MNGATMVLFRGAAVTVFVLCVFFLVPKLRLGTGVRETPFFYAVSVLNALTKALRSY